MSIAYATSDRGGCHLRAYPIGPEILSGTMPADTLDGKAAFCIEKQHYVAAKFSAVFCDFWAIAPEHLSLLYGHLQGRTLSEAELQTIGERIWNLGRLFNLREGVEPDTVPRRLLQTEDLQASRGIGRDDFQAAIQEYYRLRGWSRSGVPTEEKLAALELDVRLPLDQERGRPKSHFTPPPPGQPRRH